MFWRRLHPIPQTLRKIFNMWLWYNCCQYKNNFSSFYSVHHYGRFSLSGCPFQSSIMCHHSHCSYSGVRIAVSKYNRLRFLWFILRKNSSLSSPSNYFIVLHRSQIKNYNLVDVEIGRATFIRLEYAADATAG